MKKDVQKFGDSGWMVYKSDFLLLIQGMFQIACQSYFLHILTVDYMSNIKCK